MHPVDEAFYMQLFTPRKPKSAWAQSNKTRVARLIDQGLMMPAGLAAIEAAKACGSWDALTAAESMTVPPELRKAINASALAKRHWPSFTDSQRKQFLYYLASAKRAETREKRIREIVSHVERKIRPGQANEARRRQRSRHRVAEDGDESAQRGFIADEIEDGLHYALDWHGGRVDVAGVGREGQRRNLARGVGGIARFDRLGDRRLPRLAAGMRRIVGASPRALFLRCVEIDLHIGIRKHHRPDVSPFHHDAAAFAVATLTRDENLADAWQPGHRGRGLVHLRRSNRPRYVMSIDRDDATFDADRRVAGDAGHASLVIERHPVVRRHPGHRAVHGAGIDMAIAKTLRQCARHSPLPRTRRTVDGDDQLLHSRFVIVICDEIANHKS